MGVIGNLAVTLQDVAKRLDANGKIDKIVEILNQQNEILEDMLWIEATCPPATRPQSAPGSLLSRGACSITAFRTASPARRKSRTPAA